MLFTIATLLSAVCCLCVLGAVLELVSVTKEAGNFGSEPADLQSEDPVEQFIEQNSVANSLRSITLLAICAAITGTMSTFLLSLGVLKFHNEQRKHL